MDLKKQNGRLRPKVHKNRESEANINAYRMDNFLTIKELADKLEIHPQYISNLNSGIYGPFIKKTTELRPEVKKLMEFFGCSFEDLFPRYGCKINPEENLREDALFLMGNYSFDPEKEMNLTELSKQISFVLSALKPRERKIICLRFGLGVEPMTLKEIGNILGVHGHRILQIENKAIIKLRRCREYLQDFR